MAVRPPSFMGQFRCIRGETWGDFRLMVGPRPPAFLVFMTIGFAILLLIPSGSVMTPSTGRHYSTTRTSSLRTDSADLSPVTASIEFPNGTNWGHDPVDRTYPGTDVAPYHVDLTAAVTGGMPPYRYEWNGGDGTMLGTFPTWNHTWETAGSFIVTLRVTDSGGNSTICQEPLAIFPPSSEEFTTMLAGPATVGAPPLNVDFAVSYTSQKFVTAVFDFGDGTQKLGVESDQWITRYHTYSAPGQYEMTMTVEEYNDRNRTFGNATAIDTVIVAGNDSPPRPRLGLPYGTLRCLPDPVLNNTYSAEVFGGQPPYQYLWSLGGSFPLWAGAEVNRSYTLKNTPGNFIIEVVVQDSKGRVGTTAQPLVGPSTFLPSCSGSPPLNVTPAAGQSPWELGFWIATVTSTALAVAVLALARRRGGTPRGQKPPIPPELR